MKPIGGQLRLEYSVSVDGENLVDDHVDDVDGL